MKHFITFILLLKVGFLHCQDYRTIAGKVMDSQNREPLPYAHLTIKGETFGTVSNETGEFVFHIPQRTKPDTILVSFIGYESNEIAVTNIDISTPINIHLIPKPIILEELTVASKRISASEVIQEVVRRILLNYSNDTHVLKGFFRDWKTVDFNVGGEDNGVLVEAAVNVVEPGYLEKGKKGHNKVYIKEIRRSQLPENSKWNYYNSLSELLKMNYIKNNKAKEFNERESILSLPNNYVFTFANEQVDDQYFVIDGSTPDNIHCVYKFYINNTDYAIERLDYVTKESFVRGEWTINSINNTQHFQKLNGKWYLSYIKRNWQIENRDLNKGNLLRSEEYHLEFLVNQILFGNQFDEEQLGYPIDRKKPLEFQLNEYNEHFWKHYNVVEDNPLNLSTQTFFEKNYPLNEQFQNSGEISLSRKNENQIPELTDNNNRWVFTKADTLQGSLNMLRSCYDIFYYDLNMKIMPDTKEISGTSIIHFMVKNSTDRIQIDLNSSIKIISIEWVGVQLPFSRDFNAVFVQFPKTLPSGTKQFLSVKYSGTPLAPDFTIPNYGAFVWSTDNAGNPWIQSICQGSGANGWWPNKDHLSDKPDSVLLTVEVPSNIVNVSNGQLLKKTIFPNSTIYQWKISYPILNYNISVSAGNYIHWEEIYKGKSNMTLSYYSLKEREKDAKKAYMMVPQMIHVYESYFGPYPFERDGLKLIQAPYPMEHQSCISVGNNFDEDLILHETAHEWWGNSVSCTDLADIWIHEAFATYAVYLYKESQDGKEDAAKYLDYLASSINDQSPIVGIFGINHIHYDFSDSYSKGALLLHTLRQLINNDSVWFDILISLQRDYKYKSITTPELVKQINKISGQDFTYLFDQFLYRVEIPLLDLKIKEAGNRLSVDYRWQNVKPNFVMPIRVSIAQNKFEYIYPSTIWKNIELTELRIDQFKVEVNKLIGTHIDKIK